MALLGFGEISEQLRRSTVLISSTNHGNGSGIIWSSDGTIITNAHVVRGSQARVQLWDGREFSATITSRDSRRDLAALHIAAGDLPAVSIADSSRLRPGELVIAVGNPLGFIGALTTGIIHSIGPMRGTGSARWLQTTARLAPGNSGGPLADARGRVIGVNTMVANRLALAIPGNAVQEFLSSGAPNAWLGASVHPVHVPRPDGDSFGLVLLEVEPNSPAAYASLLPGDVLLGAEDKSFASVDSLVETLRGSGLRLIRFAFLRGDYQHVRHVTVQLGGQFNSGRGVAA